MVVEDRVRRGKQNVVIGWVNALKTRTAPPMPTTRHPTPTGSRITPARAHDARAGVMATGGIIELLVQEK